MKYVVIERFVQAVRQQSRGRNSTYNMQMDQAQDLANELALMLLRENQLLEEINQLKSANPITEISVEGGSFK